MTTLSARQQAILWHRAQGLTGPQIARTLGIAIGTLAYHEQVIVTRLRARNITHAVHLGHELIGTYPDCGKRATYPRHLRHDNLPCDACKAANAAHAVDQRAGRLAPPTSSLKEAA
ncbi:LuxR C-terminal-related transcriptional regulator [Streptomyces sp. NRRL S-1824]|uniref:LuxR C-terminal-related transcriptional regulator n=1 Tax=Streptomyces sp. NRRL S-1824 TaxID=1463889 RepID=UPI0004C6B578|nr:LuxR C-terminal-related transcriptional regulator [Streptomyces sp. NRRL S-1824]